MQWGEGAPPRLTALFVSAQHVISVNKAVIEEHLKHIRAPRNLCKPEKLAWDPPACTLPPPARAR